MMMNACSFLHIMLCMALFSKGSSTPGFACSIHPIHRTGFRGEIMKGWAFTGKKETWKSTTYSARFPLSFRSDDGQMELNDLDIFVTMEKNSPVAVSFQRRATLYLMVESHRDEKVRALLNGWKALGWFELSSQNKTRKLTYGVGSQKQEIYIPTNAYVFKKNGQDERLPSFNALKRRIKKIRPVGHYFLLIAEENGSQVRRPIPPKGVRVTPGGLCPEALHDKWVTFDHDINDPQVKRYGFRTWHPLWDPCYYCSYGHEHGSAASQIMAYKPRYDYTALKNNRQKESHRGFKDFVIGTDKYWVYIGIHAHMSNPRHFGTRHHTLVMAVVEKSSGDSVFETRYKADFGALAVRARDRRIIGVNHNEHRLLETKRFRRVVNVIDPRRLDPGLAYRRDGRVMEGQYEKWATTPFCSTGRKRSGSMELDFKNPLLALRSTQNIKQGEDPNTTVLGKHRGEDIFSPHTSERRELVFHALELGGVHCFPGSGISDGRFYTDPKATKVYSAPGESRTGQYVRNGFKITIDGTYQTADPWLGLYTKEARGDFQDLALGIDEHLN